jgi:hypothetical protein
MSFVKATQFFPGSRRTTRRAPVLEAVEDESNDGGFASAAKSADTLVAVDVGDLFIANQTGRREHGARILNGPVPANSADDH